MINVQTVHKYTIKERLSVCDCKSCFPDVSIQLIPLHFASFDSWCVHIIKPKGVTDCDRRESKIFMVNNIASHNHKMQTFSHDLSRVYCRQFTFGCQRECNLLPDMCYVSQCIGSPEVTGYLVPLNVAWNILSCFFLIVQVFYFVFFFLFYFFIRLPLMKIRLLTLLTWWCFFNMLFFIYLYISTVETLCNAMQCNVASDYA